jgi:hypothetical protein
MSLEDLAAVHDAMRARRDQEDLRTTMHTVACLFLALYILYRRAPSLLGRLVTR